MRSFGGRCRYFFAIAALLGGALLVGRPVGGQETKTDTKRCFLWKVSSKTTTVYLLGSMHVAKAGLFPLPKEIEDAFAGSKKLVVEVNTVDLDPGKMLKLTLEKGFYPAGETLSKNLSEKTMALLKQYCATKKVLKVAAFDPMRPSMVSLALMVMEIKAQGFSEEGIDSHFVRKAKAQNKPIIELETAEEELELFTGLTSDLQEKMLANTLADVGGYKNLLEKMVEAWISGDAKAMEDMVLRDPVKRHPESKALMVKMFDDRNLKMMEKIEVLLQGKEICFVAVGAGHLVGDKGIVKLLEAKKYQAEQVSRAPAK